LIATRAITSNTWISVSTFCAMLTKGDWWRFTMSPTMRCLHTSLQNPLRTHSSRKSSQLWCAALLNNSYGCKCLSAPQSGRVLNCMSKD
jgi:hypothetical protein